MLLRRRILWVQVHEKNIELAKLAAREAKYEREKKRQGLRHRNAFAFFDDDHNPFEDATDAELIRMYKRMAAEREKLKSFEDDALGEEN